MWEKIFIGVVISVIGGVILAFVLWFGGGGRAWWEHRKVYNWLKNNTSDTPENSHVNTIKIAQKTGLSEDRARKACISPKIYRYLYNNEEFWSIWREEPQSIHTGKSVEEILKEISL